jgi:hypothetical protein
LAWEVAKSKHKGQRVKGIAALLLLRKINRSRSAPSPYRRAEQLTSGMTPGLNMPPMSADAFRSGERLSATLATDAFADYPQFSL